MHKSRLANVTIDCRTDDVGPATVFWSAALGWRAEAPDPDEPTYGSLDSPDDQVNVLVQAVDHPSRVHLDIETDDLEAEAARLEALGARRIAFVKRWWVMEAPTGQRFCIVRPQRPDFEAKANVWDST